MSGNPPAPQESEKLTIFQLFLVVLSVYVLISLFVQSLFDLSPEMDQMVDHLDFFICLIFMADFFIRLYQAPSKRAFLKWGWIDFVSSIPMLDSFRAGSLFRIFRVMRLLRAFRSVKVLSQYLLRNRSKNTFTTVAAVSCLLTMTGAILILNVEKNLPASNIKTPSDAIWWAVVTVTTVGYGDRFPVSDAGRAIAAVLMTAGVGLFGTFTGFVASMFVEPDIKREETEIHKLVEEIQALRGQMDSMEKKIKRSRGTPAKRKRNDRPKSGGADQPG